MDSKIEKIIEICGFRKDPYWNELEKIFSGITLETYSQILQNKDKLILDKIKHVDARPITTLKEFYKHTTIDEKTATLTTKEPILICKPLHSSKYSIHITAPVHLGEGTKLLNAQIYDATWIEPHATLEHSTIQPGNGHCFIGSNTVVSNVHELKGTFVSGGPLRTEGRSRIYMHAYAAINMIIGAYSAPSIGLTVYNHPLGNDKSIIIDPETDLSYPLTAAKENRKLPILIGCEAELGANVLLNSGTIIGEKCRIPSQSNVDGLVYIDNTGKQQYVGVRPEEKLKRTH
ncbi:MAG: hypothetical protein WC916_02215 [Candidatus Woesearchaeota archaeon]